MTSLHPASELPGNPSPQSRPELLAPAGNWDCAKAAVENGADAIYFGLDRFNARMRAQNFTEADLPELMAYLHRRGVRGYVTVNTLVFPQELPEAEQYLRTMITAGVDAVIVQDVGLCRLIRHLSPDFPIHASTQMTVTSAAGVAFAKQLGCQLVVLARECSLKDIQRIQTQMAQEQVEMPLEVFVHGALCVAYSGQCLTSEALGGRSANRGECAQACRMTYDLIADGNPVDLGDRAYLLSPQDLSGLEVLPDLIQAGLHCLKIEGRLKAPEYVANVTRVYRQALDRAIATADPSFTTTPRERYELEMAFSRGLYTGWFRGIDNQALVHGEYGKKRGVYLGRVTRIQGDRVWIQAEAPIKPGDGVVFEAPTQKQEQGGRVYTVDRKGAEVCLSFGRHDLNLRKLKVGDRLWKTSDPDLEKHIRQTYAGDTPKFQRPIWIEIHGRCDHPLVAIARDEQGHLVQLESAMPLVAAHSKPLTDERLQEQLGRLGNTPYHLAALTSTLEGAVMLPVSELNRLRRDLVEQLDQERSRPKRWQINSDACLADLLPAVESAPASQPTLIVLVRNLEQLEAAIATGVDTIYCEFEDPRTYKQAVAQVHQARSQNSKLELWVAPPRITKPGETWILDQVKASQADGYLIRNYDHLRFFEGHRITGDFSLNVANPLAASYFRQYGLERLTASYDLNIDQLTDLLTSAPPTWFEVTIHQHMPMFHMEHCVFCAFLSTGTDYTNCGRPCETHQVTLRDRIGTEHVLRADAGCRNTLFNGTAQTGAEYVQTLLNLGLRHFRIEFVDESPEQVLQTINQYQKLLIGTITGTQLWRSLHLQNQLGVTRGPLGN
ncbi:MAG: U32 family peptidase [Synechococcales cyanobacterium T60_A2020_003]|nr:U32 family peptidase [Synechococcales cyanobacterium T60_A2020_003]